MASDHPIEPSQPPDETTGDNDTTTTNIGIHWADLDEDNLKSHTSPDWQDEYIVEDIIPRGQLGMLFAAPGTGKTMLMLEAALAAASNNDLMDEFRTAETDTILWLDQDMGAEQFERRITEMLNGRNITTTDLEGFRTIPTQDVKLDTDTGEQTLEELVDETQPELIILDAFTDFVQGPLTEQRPVSEALGAVKGAVRRNVDHPCSVIIIGHTPRSDPERYFGSVENAAKPDFIWIASKRSTGVADQPDRISVTQDKDRQKDLIEGFEFEIVGGDEDEPLRCELVRRKQDAFDEVTRMRILSALQYAVEQVAEDGENEVTVAGYVDEIEKSRQYSSKTARDAWERAREAGFFRHIDTVEHGKHVYDVTQKGANWFIAEMKEQERLGDPSNILEQVEDEILDSVNEIDIEDEDAARKLLGDQDVSSR